MKTIMAKVSQNLSTDNLFHFTSKLEYIIEILKNKFFVARYVYEEIPSFKFKLAIPMKCFCDIPLGQIKKHLKHYGNYGIGITKSFAMSNYIGPVFYVHDNSDALLSYETYLSNNGTENLNMTLLPYFKKYDEIKLSNNERKIRNRLYDEREWRFIPENSNIEFLDNIDNIQNFLDHKNNDLSNDPNFKNHILKFEYSNLSYIFLRTEKDIKEVYETIYKNNTIDDMTKAKLMSKIITSKQIERDF